MRRLPPLNALRSFEAAGRLRSLTRAADELCVTHSAITQQIRLLEDYLGQKLFIREGRQLELTTPARHYLVDVGYCLSRLEEATARMGEARKSLSLRVNLSSSLAHAWLLPRLVDFQTRHPEVEVLLTTVSDMDVTEADDGCDLMIRRSDPKLRRPGFSDCFLFANQVIAVCSPDMPNVEHLKTASDLQHARLLHYAGLPEAWQYWFYHAQVQAVESLPGPYYEEFFLLIQAAANGLGVALAPQVAVRSDIEQRKLRPLFPQIVLEGPPFVCIYRTEPHRPELTAFVQWLCEQEPADRPAFTSSVMEPQTREPAS